MDKVSLHNQKVGLVLSGGGALGAYQVGLVDALAELNVKIEAVSGASIGALNGAVLASSPSLKEAAQRLDNLWERLEQESPLEVNKSVYLRMLMVTGLRLNAVGRLATILSALPNGLIPSVIGSKLSVLRPDALFTDDPLHELMEEYLDTGSLAEGLPLYVSLYEAGNSIVDVIDVFSSELGIRNNKESEVFHVQSLSPEDQRTALLGSAALPLLFQPKELGGKKYSDGGAGGWRRSQGNTPVQPLIDAGCNVIIVSHLSEGSMWSRHDFDKSEVTFIEIRPKQSLARHEGFGGGVKDLLGFQSKYIGGIKQQGYLDTKSILERILKPIKVRASLEASQKLIAESLNSSKKIDSELDDIMSKF